MMVPKAVSADVGWPEPAAALTKATTPIASVPLLLNACESETAHHCGLFCPLGSVKQSGSVAAMRMLYGPPAVLLAVKTGAAARPLAALVTLTVPVPLGNVPLAPSLAGVALKVTVTPPTPTHG